MVDPRPSRLQLCSLQLRLWKTPSLSGQGLKSTENSDMLLLIMEYLVKVNKKAHILELKRRNMKIIVLTTNTPYPSRKIRRICVYTSPKTMKETRSNTPRKSLAMSLTGAASRWLRNKPSGLITTWEDLKIKFLSKYYPPAHTVKKIEEINNFQQEPDENLYQAWERFKELLMKGAIPSKTAVDAKVSIQEMAEYSQKWHNGTSRTRSTETSDGLAAIQAQLNILGREIKKVNKNVYAAQVGCEQCKGSHYTKDCPLKEEGKTFEEAYYTQFGAPIQGGGYRVTTPRFYQRKNANPSYQERRQPMEETLSKFMGESVKRYEENYNLIKEIRASSDAAIRNQRASIKTLEIQIGQMSKSILTIFEVDASSIRRIGSQQYAVSTKQNNFLILDMPEDIKVSLILGRPFLSTAYAKIDLFKRKITLRTLVLNRSLDPFFEDYIELNDLNVPLDLRRDQVDDLMPTIEECVVIEEFRARNKDRKVSKKFGYPSDCDHNKKIRIDCAHNLKFSCMIDFAVLEDMDVYRDKGMGDVIFGKPFLREVRINARRFEGMISIYHGNEEVTYQMVQSHPRFKHHTNEQCNKIPPLLKMSEEDMMNGISHSYQKLKSFDKEVLNLGPEYVRDTKMEE
ncbi:pyruvate dehydrogenase (acetyl-transferring) kinase, mitochondrial [Tanacetum coccineum]